MTDRARDRRELAKVQPPKDSWWPRTARREERIRRVLARRQPDLTVVLENVHDHHNVSAVLRSCDAVGIMAVHVVYSSEQAPAGAFARTTSASAAKWINVVKHASIAECYDHLTVEGFVILTAAIEESARTLYELDLTGPVALVFGNEMRGLTDEAIALSHGSFEIPMRGMVESLNISVACAVSLFEAARQRALTGAYARPKLAPDEFEQLMADWLLR